MNLATAILVCFAVLLATDVSAEPPANYTDPTYGFSLTTPKFPAGSPNTSTSALFVMGPASEAFAPNLNVQVQHVSMSLAEFAELSRAQFRDAGFTLHKEESVKLGSEPGILWRYSGQMQGRRLEFVAVAVLSGRNVLLATGAATPEQFKKVGEGLRASVLSLRPAKK